MKRRKPLKRSALARGESVLRRAPKGSGPRGHRQPNARTGRGLHREVRLRSDGRCVSCSRVAPPRAALRLDAGEVHHVFPKRKTQFPELADDPRGMVLVCGRCHGRHELAHQRLPLSCLPPCVFELAAEVGDRALLYLQRTYRR